MPGNSLPDSAAVLEGGSLNSEQQEELIMSKASAQVKFTIDAETVSRFKARCASGGVSMTSAVRGFMNGCQQAETVRQKTDTRPNRNRAAGEIIGALKEILQNGEEYRNRIPEQFQGRHEAADRACEQLSQAIECLEDAY
jgi:antitoxin component of RelBE/YafQ-DinJ toxin-antitoxin module